MNPEDVKLEPPKLKYGKMTFEFAMRILVITLSLGYMVLFIIDISQGRNSSLTAYNGIAVFASIILISTIAHGIVGWKKRKEIYQNIKMRHYFNTKVNKFLKTKYRAPLGFPDTDSVMALLNGSYQDEILGELYLYNGDKILDYAEGRISELDSKEIALVTSTTDGDYIEVPLSQPVLEEKRRRFPEKYDFEKIVKESIEYCMPKKMNGTLYIHPTEDLRSENVLEIEYSSKNNEIIYDPIQYNNLVSHQITQMNKHRMSAMAIMFYGEDGQKILAMRFLTTIQSDFIDIRSTKRALRQFKYILDYKNATLKDFTLVDDNLKFN